MARFTGTKANDTVAGPLLSSNVFDSFGIGQDTLTGGNLADVFNLLVDERTDAIDGGKGIDRVDYTVADRGLTLDLSVGRVTGVFGGGSVALHVSTVATLKSIEDVTGTRFVDTIIGSSLSNLLDGGAAGDVIDGREGSDTVSYARSVNAVQINLNEVIQHGGDAESDQLYSIERIIGSSRNDSLIGLFAGNNVIEGGGGADYINGTSVTTVNAIVNGTLVIPIHINTNRASYLGSLAAVQIDLNQVLQQSGDAEGDQLYAIDDVWGSALADRITGNAFNNQLDGQGGNDTFFHTGGIDHIEGGRGLDTYVVGQLAGMGGVDIQLNNATDGFEVVTGPLGNQTLVPKVVTLIRFADGTFDVLSRVENFVGSQNNDTINVSAADPAVGSTIDGDRGVDYITGSAGVDHIFGGGDGDTINAGDGADDVHGGRGDDILSGGIGRDLLFGDDQDDELAGGADADALDGGSGNNTASYIESPVGVGIALERMIGSTYSNVGIGLRGDAEGDTLVNIQNLLGSNHDDVLVGDFRANVLAGGVGNDRLTGGGGNDTLIGGQGNDTLTGNGGLRAGSSDADVFQFTVITGDGDAEIGLDTITDYQRGIDTLQFRFLGPNQEVNVAQNGSSAVVTIDEVVGSITLLNTLASDVTWVV